MFLRNSGVNDWTEQWDGCDTCEVCDQLVAPNRQFQRANLAITLLYTLGALTEAEMDKAKYRLASIAIDEKSG